MAPQQVEVVLFQYLVEVVEVEADCLAVKVEPVEVRLGEVPPPAKIAVAANPAPPLHEIRAFA